MPLTLSSIPGFADIPDAALAADKPALGILMARISSNAAFGMCRLEIFQGLYKNGDTVDLPTSPIDGYNYERDELLYSWNFQTTGSPTNNWASYGPPWTMWFVAASVNQTTGEVAALVGYRGNDDHKDRQASTNDGVLTVFTIAQRRRSTLTLSAVASYTVHNDADFYTDEPLKTGLITEMSHSAKYGIVNTEVMYLGVFKNGDVISAPTSPADGYVYAYQETRFVACVRWTADDDGTNLKVPDMSKGQLSDWAFSVDSVGNVSCTVKYELGTIHTYHTGRCAVFAFCQRGATLGTFTIPSTRGPWSVTGPPNTTSFPYGDGTGGSPVVVASGLTAGQIISVTYVSGGVQYQPGGSPPFTTDGIGNPNGIATGIGSTGNRFPAFYDSSSNLRLVGLIGAFVDNSGNVISVKAIGNGRVLTVPVGATKFQVGINDDKFNDNAGSYVVSVSAGILGDLADDFAEIAEEVFFPGETLRVTTMQQLAANIREAAATPEYFGTVTYSHGDTVPLPTSAVDGYAYSRDELTYVWDWADTGPDPHTTDRMVMAVAHVDSSTGAVTAQQYRYISGGSDWHIDNTGTLNVLVFAKRQTANSPLTTPVVAPIAGTVVDDSDGTITVDGV